MVYPRLGELKVIKDRLVFASDKTPILLHLLTGEQHKHQPINFYAEQLRVSPKYLSTICREKSGKTASEWIREYVNEDIRHQLLHTTLSVKEIAQLLGFPNSSFFGKYVRQHFGCSPLEYRSRQE